METEHGMDRERLNLRIDTLSEENERLQLYNTQILSRVKDVIPYLDLLQGNDSHIWFKSIVETLKDCLLLEVPKRKDLIDAKDEG
jgi:hypothetical protein